MKKNTVLESNERTAAPIRFQELDILKGIGILFMIANHVKFGDIAIAYIRAFCMPLFFVASGFLWRDRGERLLERLWKRVKKLLLPYLVFGAAFCLLATVVSLLRAEGSRVIADHWLKLFLYPTQYLPYSVPLWFFPCMVISDFFYTLIQRVAGWLAGEERLTVKRLIVAGLMVCAVAAGGCIYSSRERPVLFWAAEPALTAVFFIFFGTVLRQLFDRAKFDPFNMRALPFLILFTVSTATAFLNPLIDMRTARYCIVPLYFFNGCAMTVVWMNLGGLLLRLSNGSSSALSGIAKRSSAFFQHLSVHSLTFVCLNWIIIQMSDLVFSRFLPGVTLPVFLTEAVIQLILTVFLCWIADKVLRRTPLRVIVYR